jgi:hypothetical protein
MCKAFVLSLLTLGIVLAMYAAPVTIPQGWFLPAVAVLVTGALLAGRFLWDQPISLLKPVGLACINAPFWIAGTVSTCEDCRLDTLVPKSSLGRIKDLEAIVGEHFFQEVIITDELIEKAELVGLLDFFTSRGITIWFVPKLMPIIHMKLDIDSLYGMPMVRLRGGRNEWLFLKAKHAFDAVIGIVATAVALPILLASALAIVLDSNCSKPSSWC